LRLTYQVLISVSGTLRCVGDILDGKFPYIKGTEFWTSKRIWAWILFHWSPR